MSAPIILFQHNIVDWLIHPNTRIITPYSNPCAHLVTTYPQLQTLVDTGTVFVTLANRATDPETADLWHQRLGHVNARSLAHLLKHNKIQGISVTPAQLAHAAKHCEVCIMAKHAHAPHPTRQNQDIVFPGEVLHSDICGPYPVRALGGQQYVVTLLDQASDYAAVGLLKTKDEASPKLKTLIQSWQSITGRKCKVLYSDRGGEYMSNAFKA